MNNKPLYKFNSSGYFHTSHNGESRWYQSIIDPIDQNLLFYDFLAQLQNTIERSKKYSHYIFKLKYTNRMVGLFQCVDNVCSEFLGTECILPIWFVQKYHPFMSSKYYAKDISLYEQKRSLYTNNPQYSKNIRSLM